jgi:hypothetical protein
MSTLKLQTIPDVIKEAEKALKEKKYDLAFTLYMVASQAKAVQDTRKAVKR